MQNMTSGLKYVGQTYNLHKRSYCGSGQYWVTHCKKHGGHGRKNIKLLDQFWAETEAEAQQWLDAFEKDNPDYFKATNTAWANRAKETTADSAFCGVTKEKRIEYARAGGLASAQVPGLMSRMAARQGQINVQSGHMQRIQKIGCVLGGKKTGAKNLQSFHGTERAIALSKANGSKVSTKRHAEKDPTTGKSKFAVRIGVASNATKKLMAEFWKEFGVGSPGSNYANMDREAFKAWRASRDR
jgi:kynurenine formamidase